jgi:hypothetical protein
VAFPITTASPSRPGTEVAQRRSAGSTDNRQPWQLLASKGRIELGERTHGSDSWGRAHHSPAPRAHPPAAAPPDIAFTSMLNAAMGTAAAMLEQKVVAWADKLDGGAGGGDSSGGLTGLADAGLDELAEGGGARGKAGAEGVKAGLHG